MRIQAFFVLFLLLGFSIIPAAHGQSVVAVRSGLINFLEGDVLLDGQRLERNFGKYTRLKQGSDLVTRSGRAEVLLGPSTYLRIGEDSSVHLVSDSLSDVQVRLTGGSVILDSTGSGHSTPVTISFKDSKVRILAPGKYRVDAEPAQLRVYKGTAEVAMNGNTREAGPSTVVPLDGASVVRRFADGSDRLLDLWSDERRMLVSNKMLDAQSIRDPLFDPDPVSTGGLDAYLGYLPSAQAMSVNLTPTVPLLTGGGLGYGGYGYDRWGYGGIGGIGGITTGISGVGGIYGVGGVYGVGGIYGNGIGGGPLFIPVPVPVYGPGSLRGNQPMLPHGLSGVPVQPGLAPMGPGTSVGGRGTGVAPVPGPVAPHIPHGR